MPSKQFPGNSTAIYSMDPKVIVLAGTAGTGKSTVAEILLKHHSAKYPDAKFIEGDTLHPPANVAKMSAGIPLGDDDRWGWLEKVATFSSATAKKHGLCIVACSSLKKKYRDFMREKCPDTTFYFVFLYGTKEEVFRRLEKRSQHFMKANMMESQFKDLELPKSDEPHCCIVHIDHKSIPEVQNDVKEKVVALLAEN